MAKSLFPYSSLLVLHSRSLTRKTRCASLLSLIAGLSLCVVLIGCGGGSSSSNTSTSTPVAVTLLPGAAAVVTGTTEQFTATVTNASNTAVTYEVNNVAGGAATTGTISTTGLYTAPTQVPNPNTVEIEAISQQDTTQKGTASVTITLPPPNTHIDISPSAPVVQTGGVQTFTAAINGQPASVTWTLNCASTPATACGTISGTGVYTAPLTPPLGGTVHLTATDNNPQDNTPPGGASITVQFSPGTLTGQYAFSLVGTGTAMAGTLKIDGNGVIAGGSGDLNNGSASSFTINASGYTVGTDGRGIITLNTTAGTFTFALSVVNHSHGLLVRFDSGTAQGTGTIDLQDASKFTLAALTGNYTIAFANRGGSLAAQVAGAGAFAINSGAISSAELDLNSGGVPSFVPSVSGTIGSPDSSGRGTLTFGSSNFAYYILDGTHLKLVELGSSAGTGDIVQQNLANPANFNSLFAATLFGFTNAGPVAQGTVFALDGSNNVKNITFDLNQNGSVQSSSGVSSTYTTPDAAGRITFTVPVGGSTLTYAAYTGASGALNLLEIDPINVASGTAFPQQSSAFSNAATFGNFALSATGFDLSNGKELDMVGQWLPNGGSAFVGILDVNDGGSPSHGTQNSLSGSYPPIGGNGRASSGSMQASNFQPAATVNFYVVDENTVLFIEVDSDRVLTGIVQKQF